VIEHHQAWETDREAAGQPYQAWWLYPEGRGGDWVEVCRSPDAWMVYDTASGRHREVGELQGRMLLLMSRGEVREWLRTRGKT